MIATGNVVFKSQNGQLASGVIDYNSNTGIIFAKNDVFLNGTNSSITSDSLYFWSNIDSVFAIGNANLKNDDNNLFAHTISLSGSNDEVYAYGKAYLLNQNTNISDNDTLFFNEGDNIIINIAEAEKIKSIETITRPNQIELDAQSLQFKWDTNEEDAGEYFLEYNITYSTNTVLEQSNISNNQLALNSVETIETSVNKHIIYINDVPKIIIENTELSLIHI